MFQSALIKRSKGNKHALLRSLVWYRSLKNNKCKRKTGNVCAKMLLREMPSKIAKEYKDGKRSYNGKIFGFKNY
jgi:hypothetical protein